MDPKQRQSIPVITSDQPTVRMRRGTRTIPHTFVAPVTSPVVDEPSRDYPEDARSLAHTMPIGGVSE